LRSADPVHAIDQPGLSVRLGLDLGDLPDSFLVQVSLELHLESVAGHRR
jgi:hypothetical protein